MIYDIDTLVELYEVEVSDIFIPPSDKNLDAQITATLLHCTQAIEGQLDRIFIAGHTVNYLLPHLSNQTGANLMVLFGASEAKIETPTQLNKLLLRVGPHNITGHEIYSMPEVYFSLPIFCLDKRKVEENPPPTPDGDQQP